MKQIVVISGKGGTGKTITTGAFAALAKNKVMADCDVDAADLHLLLSPDIKERHEFKSGKSAVIDKKLCVRCGKCISICRFDAISEDFVVDPVSCEGCAFCSHICPNGSIKMKENMAGEWFLSDTRFGPLVHAKLGIAEENSGKLVASVRKKAKELAEKNKADWVIIDGAPGIGCPVIASLSGIDCAIVVTEPTISGLHDADRVIRVARHFSVPVKLIINKYDLNPDMTMEIEKYCGDNNIQALGRIGFDKSIVDAMVNARTIIEHKDSKAKEEIITIWSKIEKELS
ncbi:MAG: ATP-binding protein [Candidatus Omnitrophica bacterium]|nr:ATP-binding protein [Candidatus Omnitrophota bacterium]MBU4590501.1 ATP-binding protein [Candidatus Omnitrophota bacterium]